MPSSLTWGCWINWCKMIFAFCLTLLSAHSLLPHFKGEKEKRVSSAQTIFKSEAEEFTIRAIRIQMAWCTVWCYQRRWAAKKLRMQGRKNALIINSCTTNMQLFWLCFFCLLSPSCSTFPPGSLEFALMEWRRAWRWPVTVQLQERGSW